MDRLDGTIYANETLDREEQSSYEIIVKASNDNDYQHKNVIITLYEVLTYITQINFPMYLLDSSLCLLILFTYLTG